MDVPAWVTLVSVLGAAVLAGTFGHLTGVRSARIAAVEAQKDRQQERERLDHERTMRQEARLDRAWDLCQSTRADDWQAGVALLEQLLAEPDLAPQVERYAASLVAIVFQGELAAYRRDYQDSERVPDVDMYVEAGDDGGQEGIDERGEQDEDDPEPGADTPAG